MIAPTTSSGLGTCPPGIPPTPGCIPGCIPFGITYLPNNLPTEGYFCKKAANPTPAALPATPAGPANPLAAAAITGRRLPCWGIEGGII